MAMRTVDPIFFGALFFVAAIMEISGGYLSLALDKRKENKLTFHVAIILFVYGIIPTLQPVRLGRVYAAYGGIFIIFHQ